MNRKEIERLKDSNKPFNGTREDWYEIGCIDGLAAASAEPNLESLWHDASEIPYETFFMCPLGRAWCNDVNLTRCAYISDLLPKGGEK